MNEIFRIQAIRKGKKMSQQDLAKKMGYSGAAIAMWETGDRNPPSRILPKLAEVLGCTIEDLYIQNDTKDSA